MAGFRSFDFSRGTPGGVIAEAGRFRMGAWAHWEAFKVRLCVFTEQGLATRARFGAGCQTATSSADRFLPPLSAAVIEGETKVVLPLGEPRLGGTRGEGFGIGQWANGAGGVRGPKGVNPGLPRLPPRLGRSGLSQEVADRVAEGRGVAARQTGFPKPSRLTLELDFDLTAEDLVRHVARTSAV